jgi:hypothetical protein
LTQDKPHTSGKAEPEPIFVDDTSRNVFLFNIQETPGVFAPPGSPAYLQIAQLFSAPLTRSDFRPLPLILAYRDLDRRKYIRRYVRTSRRVWFEVVCTGTRLLYRRRIEPLGGLGKTKRIALIR